LNATHAAAAAAPTSATTYALDPASSAIHYHIVHKLHRVTGRSQGAQGKAAIQDGGKVVAVVLVPASSFRSGDDDRDARVREILGSRGASSASMARTVASAAPPAVDGARSCRSRGAVATARP